MSSFAFKYFLLLYIYIILICRIIIISALVHPEERDKQITKHLHTPNRDLPIPKELRTSIEWLERNDNFNQIKKRKEESLNNEMNKEKPDADPHSVNTRKEKLSSLDLSGNQEQFMQIESESMIYTKIYALRLQENNLRWSMTMFMGSKKTPVNLALSTYSPYTTFYCTYGPSEDKDSLKYDITSSENFILYSCSDERCGEAHGTEECLSLETHLENLKKFTKKKRICTNRFCDYVKSATFLNISGVFDNKSRSVCGFSININNDQLKGFLFRDYFFLKSRILSFYEYFGCITGDDKLQINDKLSGTLGFGMYDIDKKTKIPGIVDLFIFHALSHRNMFAVCLIEGGGFVSFGGVHQPAVATYSLKEKLDMPLGTSYFKIEWFPFADSEELIYDILVKKIKLTKDNNTLVEGELNQKMPMDSYEYFLSLPTELATQIKTKIYDICKKTNENECDKIITEGIFKTTTSIEDYPKINLIIEEGTIVIEPNDYIIKTEDNHYRIMIASSAVPKLGVPFFLNKYIIFNLGKKRIGVSRSQCTLILEDNDMHGITDPFKKYYLKGDESASEEVLWHLNNKVKIFILIGGVICVGIIIFSITFFLL